MNIDGARAAKRESDAWFFDPRIAAAQAGEEPTATTRSTAATWSAGWTRPGGRRARRKVANDDTFHFTNCSPQHEDFNQNKTTWAGLEDYVLDHAGNRDLG